MRAAQRKMTDLLLKSPMATLSVGIWQGLKWAAILHICQVLIRLDQAAQGKDMAQESFMRSLGQGALIGTGIMVVGMLSAIWLDKQDRGDKQ